MIIDFYYKQKAIMVEEIFLLIDLMEYSHPELKIGIDEEKLEIINDIVYESLSNKNKLNNYAECMNLWISNSIATSLVENVDLDWKCMKVNFIVLMKYFNLIEIAIIIKKIDKKFQKNKVIKWMRE